jgi:hypothetical protein
MRSLLVSATSANSAVKRVLPPIPHRTSRIARLQSGLEINMISTIRRRLLSEKKTTMLKASCFSRPLFGFLPYSVVKGFRFR